MSYPLSRPFRRIETLLLLGIVAAGGVIGCDKSAPKTEAAPAASSSAGVTATGPCGNYATAICDKAGAQSATCQTIKSAAEFMSPEACSAGMTNIDYSVKKIEALKSACDELAKKACEAVGPKTKTCEMVTTQTKQFTPDRCKEMLQHMPEVTAELKRMEEGNKPLSAELQAALTQGAAATFGPADAKVQVVEFSDFECPYCSRAANVVSQVKEKYGDKVRFVFRQFPLQFHPNARPAAEASLEAAQQGKFWEFHDVLFQNQKALDRASLEEHAKKAGLNMAEFKKALDTKEFAAQIDADMKLGEKVNVNGTPTLFVNGKRVDNPTDFAAVSQLIEAELKAGG